MIAVDSICAASNGIGDGGEYGAEVGAEQTPRGDADDRDKGSDQSVFDCGDTGFVFKKRWKN
jgi:hypothetical protein